MSMNPLSQNSAAAGGDSPAGARLQFHGDPNSFFRLTVRGGLKELVTLGFYRFWLLTDIRRRLWLATSIDGDALEYTGSGPELFLGYLIGFVLLAAAFSLYYALPTDDYEPFAGLAAFAFMVLLAQFAAYRARRYRLSRTVWRGVRFWMKSEAWKYALLSVGLLLASALTLGLANPWRIAALERFKLRRTFYGDLPANFEGKGSDLFKAGIKLWIIGVVAFAVSSGVIAGTIEAVGFSSVFHAQKDGSYNIAPSFLVGAIIVAVLISLAATLFGLWAAYQAVQWRWLLDGVRIAGARVACTLTRRRVIGLYFRFVKATIIIAFVAGALAVGLFAAMSGLGSWVGETATTLASTLMALAAFATLAFAAILVGAARRTILVHDFWGAVIEATSLRGGEALAAARKGGEASDALAEGAIDGGLLDGYELGAGL